MRVVCYGDSDTYGHDPRSFLGGRYPKDVRWTGRLAGTGKYEIENLGLNGREIPARPTEDLAAALPGADLVVVLLGSNDLLAPGFGPEKVAERMDHFLGNLPEVPVLLIAPPKMKVGVWITEEAVAEESARMAEVYRPVAEKHHTFFVDANPWDIPMEFDGVHFTEDGHKRFARQMEQALDAIASGEAKPL